jgi:hypothetical protein
LNNDPRRNAEGYPDPTAYTALRNIENADDRFHKLLNTIFDICDDAGFQIQGRVVLLDRETGKVYR